MINYDALLGRADDDTLQRLIGTGAVKLLNLLDPTLARPSQLRRLIIGFRTPAEVLRDPVARQALFLLLPPADAAELTRVLDLDPADPYLALAGVTVRRGSRRERALLSALGIDTEDVPSPDASPTCSDVSPSYQLFAHQRRTARDVLEHLEVDDNRRVLLHMPTGAGKTRTSMHVVADFLRHREPALVTWLAYSEELCEQAAAEFESAWAALGDRDLHVYRYFGARNIDFKDIRDGLVVSGLDKISRTPSPGPVRRK